MLVTIWGEGARLLYKLRILAVAFLLNGNEVLMMQRSNDRQLFAGFWAGVGGHVEPHEINDPRSSCLRELREEIGLEPADISDLRLCYIVNRLAGEEIRVQYVYFGRVQRQAFPDCVEGSLHWVNLREAISLKASFTTQQILNRYTERSMAEEALIEVGTVTAKSGSPFITWAPLQDWEN